MMIFGGSALSLPEECHSERRRRRSRGQTLTSVSQPLHSCLQFRVTDLHAASDSPLCFLGNLDSSSAQSVKAVLDTWKHEQWSHLKQ